MKVNYKLQAESEFIEVSNGENLERNNEKVRLESDAVPDEGDTAERFIEFDASDNPYVQIWYHRQGDDVAGELIGVWMNRKFISSRESRLLESKIPKFPVGSQFSLLLEMTHPGCLFFSQKKTQNFTSGRIRNPTEFMTMKTGSSKVHLKLTFEELLAPRRNSPRRLRRVSLFYGPVHQRIRSSVLRSGPMLYGPVR